MKEPLKNVEKAVQESSIQEEIINVDRILESMDHEEMMMTLALYADG